MSKSPLMGIYLLACVPINKVYVGLSTDIAQREKSHFSYLKNNRHNNKEIQKDYNTYGVNSFSFKVLEIVESIDLLESKEMHYIKKYNALEFGYNKNQGGSGWGMHERIGIPIDEDFKSKFEKLAAKKGVSVSFLAREALKKFLEENE